MAPAKTLQFAKAFCDTLNGLIPGWFVSEGVIRGPEDAAVRFSEQHNFGSEKHVDVEFCFNDSDLGGLRIWDCVGGFGNTLTEYAYSAAHIWGATSAAALLELKYSLSGAYADHFHGSESQGLSGWHCICSAIIGYGSSDSGPTLQNWWLSQHTVLPALSAALSDLSEDRPHGIKILLGGKDIAEVRVDGNIHERASEVLLSLDWPRLEAFGLLRAFVITLHRE